MRMGHLHSATHSALPAFPEPLDIYSVAAGCLVLGQAWAWREEPDPSPANKELPGSAGTSVTPREARGGGG